MFLTVMHLKLLKLTKQSPLRVCCHDFRQGLADDTFIVICNPSPTLGLRLSGLSCVCAVLPNEPGRNFLFADFYFLHKFPNTLNNCSDETTFLLNHSQ